jgi:molybdate/tungstate transport system substrate-binding protein
MTEFRPRGPSAFPLPLAALLVMSVAACGPPSDARGGGASAAGAADSLAPSSPAPPRLAIDATLSILTAGPLSDVIRAAADSFGAREAVRVVHDTLSPLDFDLALPSRDESADIVALSDGALVRRLVDPGQATWYLRFASNRIVVAWGDSSRRAATVDSTAWWKVLLRRDTKVGRADPTLDPLGIHTLLAMRLAEQATGERGLAPRLLAASPTSSLRPDADSLAASIRAGTLDYIWTYESAAQRSGLHYVSLGRNVDLGDDAIAERYASATVAILPRAHAARDGTDTTHTTHTTDTTGMRDLSDSSETSGATGGAGSGADSILVRGAPLRYSLSIPRQASNPAVAERFIRFLFSEEGRSILRRGEVTLLDQLVAVGSGIPAAVAAVSDSVVAVRLANGAADSLAAARPPR